MLSKTAYTVSSGNKLKGVCPEIFNLIPQSLTAESGSQNISKNPGCASHRGVKITKCLKKFRGVNHTIASNQQFF